MFISKDYGDGPEFYVGQEYLAVSETELKAATGQHRDVKESYFKLVPDKGPTLVVLKCDKCHSEVGPCYAVTQAGQKSVVTHCIEGPARAQWEVHNGL